MTRSQPSGRTVGAVLIALTAALIFRALLQTKLIDRGMPSQFATDLAYLIVPLILAVLLLPLWNSHKEFLLQQFSRKTLTRSVVLQAIVIGVLLHLTWWCQIIAGTAFGYYQSDDPTVALGPEISFQCASSGAIASGIIVMVFLVPLIEEVVHRAIVVNALRRHGMVLAIGISSLAFMMFHSYATWIFALLGGVVFGIQYWCARSLWPSLISHATANALVQLDQRCLSVQWNPPVESLPLLNTGAVTTGLLLFCLFSITVMLQRNYRDAVASR